MSLFERLEEYSGSGGAIGGRNVGARNPVKIPLADVSANGVKSTDQLKNAKRRALKRADTRAYLRQVALGEARRPLQTLGS